jgi:transferase CAF17, mitochondrial
MPPLTRRLAAYLRLLPSGLPLHTSPLTDPSVLTTRLALVRFAGPEAARFLHSLLTMDLLTTFAAAPQRYRPTPNTGRFLYDLFLYRPHR